MWHTVALEIVRAFRRYFCIFCTANEEKMADPVSFFSGRPIINLTKMSINEVGWVSLMTILWDNKKNYQHKKFSITFYCKIIISVFYHSYSDMFLVIYKKYFVLRKSLEFLVHNYYFNSHYLITSITFPYTKCLQLSSVHVTLTGTLFYGAVNASPLIKTLLLGANPGMSLLSSRDYLNIMQMQITDMHGPWKDKIIKSF